MQGSDSSGVFQETSSSNYSHADTLVSDSVNASIFVITEGLRGIVVSQFISAFILDTPFG